MSSTTIPAPSGAEARGDRARVAVVQRPRAVEQVGRGRAGRPRTRARQGGPDLVDRRVDLLGAGVGVPDERDRAGRTESLDRAVRSAHSGDLRGERHRGEVASGRGRDLAHELGVAGDHVGGVLGPAPGAGEERSLEVDPGDLARIGEVRE